MGKIYRTTGKVSFYKMPQLNTSSPQINFVQKVVVQFNIDGIPLLVFFTYEGNCLKIPYRVKIIPDCSDLISFIYCGILEPNEDRKEYNVKIEYSIKVILDIIEGMREFSMTSEQKNILLKRL